MDYARNGILAILVLLAAACGQQADTPANQADSSVSTSPAESSTAVTTKAADDGETDSTNATNIEASATDSADSEPSVVVYTAHESRSSRLHDVIELSDGRLASTAFDGVHVWDPADPTRPLAVYDGHQVYPPVSIAELPDGRLLSADFDVNLLPPNLTPSGDPDDFGVHIWDPADPNATASTYVGHAYGAMAVAVLRDGRVATGGFGTVNLWSPTATAETGVVLPPGADPGVVDQHTVSVVVELSDGRLATEGVGSTQLWDPTDPAAPPLLFGGGEKGGRIVALIELADGRVASGGDGLVYVWDPKDPGPILATYRGHEDTGLSALTQLADGQIASADSQTGLVHIWDPDNPEVTPGYYEGHAVDGAQFGSVPALVTLSDGRVASAGPAGRSLVGSGLESGSFTVQIWDPASVIAPNEREDPAEPQVETAVDSGPITHQDILDAIARDEPNIFYLGDCTGENQVQSYPAPAGATPFCGTIVSSSGSEAIVELAEEYGIVTLRFFNTDGGWRVDWDSAQ